MISVLYGTVKEILNSIAIVLITIVEIIVNFALSVVKYNTKPDEKRKMIDRSNRARTMKNLIHYRILGHVVFGFLLIKQVVNLRQNLVEKLPSHPELEEISFMYCRYLTIWNIYLQICYAVVALTCDVFNVLKVDFLIPYAVKKHRFTWNAGVFWPLSFIVFLFWPFYLYQKDLMLIPAFALVVSEPGNFVFHGVVVLFALWELTFLPKPHPKVRFRSFNLILAFCVMYTTVLMYTRYVDFGSWPYNVLNYTEDSLICMVLIALFNMTAATSYFLQGYVKNFIWQQIGLA